MSPPRTLNCGRLQSLAMLRQAAEQWRDDPDPLKAWVAERAAALVEADDTRPDQRRRGEIVRAVGLYGALSSQQHRIRTALAGIDGHRERREAFRQAFPGLRDVSDRVIDGRIRRALA